MTRSQRLKRIVTLNEMQKSVASQKLAGTRGRHDGNLKKLEEFRRYRLEYARALQNPGQAMSAAAARDTRVFLGQLERTITALEADGHALRARVRGRPRRLEARSAARQRAGRHSRSVCSQ